MPSTPLRAAPLLLVVASPETGTCWAAKRRRSLPAGARLSRHEAKLLDTRYEGTSKREDASVAQREAAQVPALLPGRTPTNAFQRPSRSCALTERAVSRRSKPCMDGCQLRLPLAQAPGR
jgi:hypothetical protein